ncbi:hypothetical protein PLUTE_a4268 [Pseudoalteromonas luteoviolacea DSM 6061]|nr:hypothetical protein [Pseudoalteromonas luteoviolacea DSM 6061]
MQLGVLSQKFIYHHKKSPLNSKYFRMTAWNKGFKFKYLFELIICHCRGGLLAKS